MATSSTVAPEDLQDMQALIGTSFGSLRHSEYLLLDVEQPAAALQWLQAALVHVKCVDELGRHGQDKRVRHGEAWTIGLSYRGLVQLRVIESHEAPFPSDFRNGQASPVRRRLLRENPEREPWQWGDVPVQAAADATTQDQGAVSLLVARFHDGSAPAMHPLLEDAQLDRAGLRLVRRIRGSADSFENTQVAGRDVPRLKEPFGFADGIAQPAPRGLGHYRQTGDLNPEPRQYEQDRDVPLGEFVLGHRNAFDEPAHCPDLVRRPADAGEAFGRNGSYLVVRQIRQDVAAFRSFEQHCEQHPASGGGADLIEKMIGRRRNGEALQSSPVAPRSLDGFRYRLNDPQGFQCPMGSHVRRANPRDGLADSSAEGIAASKTRRLLRRGRPYLHCTCVDDGRAALPCTPARSCPNAEVGMVFVALVADLARQYEFVQRLWVGNPGFGGLQKANDPLLGGPARDWKFSIPGQPAGVRVQMPAMAQFTRTLGGGYFFLPGLSALRRLAESRFMSSDGSAPPMSGKMSSRTTP